MLNTFTFTIWESYKDSGEINLHFLIINFDPCITDMAATGYSWHSSMEKTEIPSCAMHVMGFNGLK